MAVCGDAHHGKAAHEACFRLEEIEVAGAVDHRRFVLVAVKDADDIVAGERGEQCLAVLVAPPVRRAAAGVVKCTRQRVPAFEREFVPAVVLEQDDRPAVGGMGGEVLLQPGNAAHRTLGPVAGEAVRLDQVQATPIPGIVVRGEVIVASRHRAA